jgi:hypothetical protein
MADEDEEPPAVVPEDPGEPVLDAETMNADRRARLEERVQDREEVRLRGRIEETQRILQTRVRCEIPCTVSLRRPIVLRVAGDGVAATDWFTVSANVRNLVISPGSGPAHTAGLVLGGIGILATAVAAIVTPFMLSAGSFVAAAPALAGFWGVALVFAAPGAGLYFANITRVRDEHGRTY